MDGEAVEVLFVQTAEEMYQYMKQRYFIIIVQLVLDFRTAEGEKLPVEFHFFSPCRRAAVRAAQKNLVLYGKCPDSCHECE